MRWISLLIGVARLPDSPEFAKPLHDEGAMALRDRFNQPPLFSGIGGR